jgi:hypothetical protein
MVAMIATERPWLMRRRGTWLVVQSVVIGEQSAATRMS